MPESKKLKPGLWRKFHEGRVTPGIPADRLAGRRAGCEQLRQAVDMTRRNVARAAAADNVRFWTSRPRDGMKPRTLGPVRTTMKSWLLRFFTWWNGQTFGTQVWTRLYGEFVGEDEYGNRYYRTRG